MVLIKYFLIFLSLMDKAKLVDRYLADAKYTLQHRSDDLSGMVRFIYVHAHSLFIKKVNFSC